LTIACKGIISIAERIDLLTEPKAIDKISGAALNADIGVLEELFAERVSSVCFVSLQAIFSTDCVTRIA